MRWLEDKYGKVFALHFKLAYGCRGASFPILDGIENH